MPPAADLAAHLATLDRAPVIAILDSGLDVFAELAPGTRVRAVRSFVGGVPAEDAVGSGTSCAEVLGQCYAGRWRRNGPGEVEIVVAQVVDRAGVVRLDAVAAALDWVRGLPIDALAVGWGAMDVDGCRGVARRLAEVGVRLVPADRAVSDLFGWGPVRRAA